LLLAAGVRYMPDVLCNSYSSIEFPSRPPFGAVYGTEVPEETPAVSVMDVAELTVKIVYTVPLMQIGSPFLQPIKFCPETSVTAVPDMLTRPALAA
jgi:hypothetical protein